MRAQPYLRTIQYVELPDGSRYSFGYDSYGLVRSLTLPTGEVVQFTHANFTDAQGNRNRWVNTMTAGGGTRTFTPATCGTNCNKVTLNRPSGDETEYRFTLNNGAWLTQTKSYTGTVASGTLLLTVNHDYDTSLPNPVSLPNR